MRFLVMVKATDKSEAGVLPSTELIAKMGAFNQQLAQAGVLLGAEGLLPTSKGARITYSGERPSVTDGPFTETKELIAGFWMIQVKSKEEAIEWLSRCPFENGEEIELRRIAEPDDYAPVLTPELRAQGERLHDQITSRQPGAAQ